MRFFRPLLSGDILEHADTGEQFDVALQDLQVWLRSQSRDLTVLFNTEDDLGPAWLLLDSAIAQ